MFTDLPPHRGSERILLPASAGWQLPWLLVRAGPVYWIEYILRGVVACLYLRVWFPHQVVDLQYRQQVFGVHFLFSFFFFHPPILFCVFIRFLDSYRAAIQIRSTIVTWFFLSFFLVFIRTKEQLSFFLRLSRPFCIFINRVFITYCL